MDPKLDVQALLEGFASDVASTFGEVLGVPASAAQAESPAAAAGLIATLPASGATTGAVRVWFEREGLVRALIAAKGLTQPPSDADIAALLTDVLTKAAAAFAGQDYALGVLFGAPAIAAGQAPGDAFAIAINVEGAGAIVVALRLGPAAATAGSVAIDASAEDVEPESTSLPSGDRLQAVLDVDLPLIVRFGGTVVPLKTLAALGSGSMVEMNRAPDDPVELLVGDRLIARGQVVVVAGNYGVRITELTDQTRAAARTLGA